MLGDRTGYIMLALTIVLLPLTSSANLVNFEDVAGSPLLDHSSITSEDFVVQHSGTSGSFAVVLVNQGSPGDFAGNGTKRLVSFNNSMITLTHDDGALFDALTFDGAESWKSLPHSWATGIRATGYSPDGTVTQVFSLDINKDPLFGFQQFTFAGDFRDLSKLEFTGVCGSPGCNPEFSIDNLSLVPVPEPATTVLFGLAVASCSGLASTRRRRSLSRTGTS
jgi:hypothetical protein